MRISAKDNIKAFMREEALKPAAAFKMPTLRELIKRFSVSLVTVTRAVKELESEGVIVCRHGSGIVAARTNCTGVETAAVHVGSGKRTLVLAVVDYPSDSVWKRVYMTEQYAKQQGFQVVNCKIHQDTRSSDIVEFVRQQQDCQALLLMVGSQQLNADDVALFGTLPMPVVFVNSMFTYEDLPRNVYMIGPDPEGAGELVAKYLCERGHRNIGLIRNEPATEFGDRYVKALNRTMREFSSTAVRVHVFPSIIRNWGNSANEARRITTENVAKIRELRISALVYSSSYGSFASMPILKEAGFLIPGELSIISGSDGWFCEYSDPPLTATSSDSQTMCFKAIDLITGKLHSEEHYITAREFLTERQSVADLVEVLYKDMKK